MTILCNECAPKRLLQHTSGGAFRNIRCKFLERANSNLGHGGAAAKASPRRLQCPRRLHSTLRLGHARKFQSGGVLHWREFTATAVASVSLRTIFFDAGGTIVHPEPGLTLAPLTARGVFPSEKQLYAAERYAKCQLDTRRAQHHSVDAQYWDIYYRRLFRELGMADDAELRAQLVAASRKGTNWRRVRPDTRQVLERLKQRYRIGLISNSDGTVQRLFELLKLDDCFDSFTDSRLCGFEKPDPRIFECALASLGATAADSLYVGDVYTVDFLGAQAVGMQAVLMDLAGAYRSMPDPRVESLTELESRLDAERSSEPVIG
jgi:HAD superfamily hydrolase (TIGR01509 family)